MIDREKEIAANYAAFQQLLPGLLLAHRGRFALMHSAEVIEVFDTLRDASLAGSKLFPDADFSVQEVTDGSIDLGWFSHALSERPVQS